MKTIVDYLSKNSWVLYLSAIVLLLVSMIIHLGFFPVFVNEDEATRGLVALEMMFSGNSITPTIQGELYLNKPPLFNWILVAFFEIFGSYDEFVLRLPSYLSLVFLGYAIYFFVKKEAGWEAGLIAAFAFLTSGRLIMFESFFCQIDMPFSLCVYAAMMTVFYFHKRNKYWSLFIVSYVITAIAFMLKGLPALVFQGLTLLTYFIYKRQFLKLFSIQHIIGGLIFLLLIGLYYLFYYLDNGSLDTIINRLWTESTERTVANNPFWESIMNFINFPLEMLYHYTPWTIFFIYFFSKKFWKTLFNTPFLKFNFMVFLINILVYWTSPGVFPKYYMMLMPMFFSIFIFIYSRHYNEFRIYNKIIEIFFMVFGVLIILFSAGFPIINTQFVIPDITIKAIFLTGFSLLFFILYIKMKSRRMILAVLIILVGKFAFNWYNWITRYPEIYAYKNDAVRAAQMTKGEELRYYDLGQDRILQYGTSFYITAEKKEIIHNDRDTIIPGIYYIVRQKSLKNIENRDIKYQTYFEFLTKERKRKLLLVKFDNMNDTLNLKQDEAGH